MRRANGIRGGLLFLVDQCTCTSWRYQFRQGPAFELALVERNLSSNRSMGSSCSMSFTSW